MAWPPDLFAGSLSFLADFSASFLVVLGPHGEAQRAADTAVASLRCQTKRKDKYTFRVLTNEVDFDCCELRQNKNKQTKDGRKSVMCPVIEWIP